MIPRIRSTHLRHSQRTHYQQQQQHQHQNPNQQHQLLLQRHHRQLELYASNLNDFDSSSSSNNNRRSPPGSARSLEEGEPPDIDIVRKQRKEEMDNPMTAASSINCHQQQQQQQQPMPNGDLNGDGAGQQAMASTSSNNPAVIGQPASSSVARNAVTFGTSEWADKLEAHHFQLRLNVGGRSAQLSLAKIRQRGDRSRLALFAEKDHAQRLLECDAFLNGAEYYFERSAAVFEHVLDYYVCGKMHRPMDICPIRWRDELEFWRVPLTALADCCKVDLLSENGRTPGTMSPTGVSPENLYVEPSCPPAEFEGIPFGRHRLVIWTFLENPRSSFPAKVLSFVSALFVLLSLACLILSSMPEFQLEEDRMTPVAGIQMLELVCMFFFSVEYILRFLVVPHKWEFFRQPLNIIDLFTIVPFLLEASLPLLGVYVELRNFRGALIVIRVLRLARVARIFKLARYSIGLRAFGETMRKSAAELSMLGMFLLTGIMLFSTAIYFFERDEPNSKFYSIPSAWWWCVATMTTVGYGDLVPVTTGGKVVAAVASVCGIIVLAFPISMIIDKFAESTGHGQQRVGSGGGGVDELPAFSVPMANSRRASLQAGGFYSRGMSRRTQRNKSRRYLF